MQDNNLVKNAEGIRTFLELRIDCEPNMIFNYKISANCM